MRIHVFALAQLVACAGPPTTVESPKGWTPGAPPELLALVPPDLRYVRIDLPPEQNAFTLWQKAIDAMVAWKDVPGLQEAWERHSALTATYPGGQDGQLLNDWLDRNRTALNLFVEGAGRPRCQYSPMMEGIDTPLSYLAALKTMAKALSLRSRRLAASGDYEGAADGLLSTLRGGELAAEGEGFLIHYLVSLAMQDIALENILWLVKQPAVPRKVLEGILAHILPDPHASEMLALAWRVELCCFNLPAISNPGRIVETTKEDGNTKPNTPGGEKVKKEMDRAAIQSNRKAAVALFCAYVRRSASLATSPWKTRDRLIERDVRAVSDEFLAAMRANASLALVLTVSSDLFKHYVLGDVEPDRELRKNWYHESYAAIQRSLPLPGEKVLLSLLMPAVESVAKADRRTRARREAVRAIVAIRLFADRRQRLPDSLDDLVTEGILPVVPVDPFSDQPLRYSKERKVVWSVGADEIDDGGAIDPELSTQSKDYAWPVQ